MGLDRGPGSVASGCAYDTPCEMHTHHFGLDDITQSETLCHLELVSFCEADVGYSDDADEILAGFWDGTVVYGGDDEVCLLWGEAGDLYSARAGGG